MIQKMLRYYRRDYPWMFTGHLGRSDTDDGELSDPKNRKRTRNISENNIIRLSYKKSKQLLMRHIVQRLHIIARGRQTRYLVLPS